MKEFELPPIIEHVPAVVFRLSHKEDNWRTLFVTANISMYGYTIDEFMSGETPWFSIVHPDDRVLVSKTVSDYEAHSINSFKLYYRLLKKNGDSVPITEYNTVNRDPAGNIICYDTVIVNNMQAESSRQIIDDHYRQQVVLNDILLSLHDSDLDHALQIILDRTGEYLDTSRALLFKDSSDHVTCKIVYEWCNKDITSVMALDYSITYETGMPEIYIALQTTGNLIIDYGEIPENCKEEFDAEGLIASAIFAIYLEGEHYGFVCFDDCVVQRRWDDDTIRFLKNISNLISTVLARQNAAKKLNQNRKTYEAVLDNVDSFIFVADTESQRIVFANRAFKNEFSEDCVGKNANDFLDIKHVIKESDKKTKSIGGYPEVFVSGKWLAVSAEEITWVDGRRVTLINCYDITAQKRLSDTLEEKIEERTRELRLMTEKAEEARRRAEEAATAKSRFLANMSHEMRTPMNAIIGMTNIYKSAAAIERKDYCVEKIEEASIHLLGVINDILDMSKIEAGKMELSYSDFDLEKMLMRITNVLNYSINQKEQQLIVKTDDKLPKIIVSDEQRISQVITNLLSNAVKFTPAKGRIEMLVAAKIIKDGICRIEIKVKDNGIGMSSEQQEKLFRTFEQADAGIARKYGGTGLGLAISMNIAKLIGGDIKVRSVLGKGSEFTFVFEASIGAAGDKNTGAEAADITKLRVLAVDDAPDVREYFSHLAEVNGFYCDTAESGNAACQIVEQVSVPYDIIFLDWNMPDMNGIEVARKLRGRNDLIIIMISAYDWSEIEHQAKEAGIEYFIPKPLYSSVVIDAMNKHAGQSFSGMTEEEEIDGIFKDKYILLAEDVEINREIVMTLLEPSGVTIDCAETGAEAVKMYEQNPERYDLILMDIHMPEVDGYEATKLIRASKSNKVRSIPIVAMTANVFKEDIDKCLASGMDDHLGKPLDIDEVFRKLKQYIS